MFVCVYMPRVSPEFGSNQCINRLNSSVGHEGQNIAYACPLQEGRVSAWSGLVLLAIFSCVKLSWTAFLSVWWQRGDPGHLQERSIPGSRPEDYRGPTSHSSLWQILAGLGLHMNRELKGLAVPVRLSRGEKTQMDRFKSPWQGTCMIASYYSNRTSEFSVNMPAAHRMKLQS